MNLDRNDPSAHILIVCYGTGGASIESEDGYAWCGTFRYEGWHPKDIALDHARYFVTVDEALRFARRMGWVSE